MTMLVTGAGGQLGREWIHLLKRKNRDFISLDSSELDISDPIAVDRVLDAAAPSVVINCAAYTDVDGASHNPETAMKINRDGVKYLSEWCAENGSTLVHFSSDYIFPGRREDLVLYPEGYPEEAEACPVNPYGESKLAGEKELLNSGASFLLLRISWLCGPFGSNFVKTMLKLGKERSSIEVVKDQLGSPTYTDTVTELTLGLLNRDERGIFHLTSGGLISWYDFADEIFRAAGLSVNVEPIMSRDYSAETVRPFFSKLNTDKIFRTLEGVPEDWRVGLNRLLQRLDRKL